MSTKSDAFSRGRRPAGERRVSAGFLAEALDVEPQHIEVGNVAVQTQPEVDVVDFAVSVHDGPLSPADTVSSLDQPGREDSGVGCTACEVLGSGIGADVEMSDDLHGLAVVLHRVDGGQAEAHGDQLIHQLRELPDGLALWTELQDEAATRLADERNTGMPDDLVASSGHLADGSVSVCRTNDTQATMTAVHVGLIDAKFGTDNEGEFHARASFGGRLLTLPNIQYTNIVKTSTIVGDCLRLKGNLKRCKKMKKIR